MLPQSPNGSAAPLTYSSGLPYQLNVSGFELVNEGRTPTVIFGPGDVKVAHSADEHVSLAEIVDCARVLASWVVRELTPPR